MQVINSKRDVNQGGPPAIAQTWGK